MKTIKILVALILILLFGITIPIGIGAYKANQFRKEAVKYNKEFEDTKLLLGEAAIKTQKALTTLALVASDLAECQGVDKDSINDISYLKGLLVKKYNLYKTD